MGSSVSHPTKKERAMMELIAKLREWLEDPNHHNILLHRVEVEELIKTVDEATKPNRGITDVRSGEVSS